MKYIMVIGIFFLGLFLLTSCGVDKKNSNASPVEAIQQEDIVEAKEALQQEAREKQEMNVESGVNVLVDEKQEMKNDGAQHPSDTVKKKMGFYSDYSPETVVNASGKIVLFFHAHWCPTCVAFDKKVLTQTIPEGLTLLKVNYDTQTDLVDKYTVTSQTTFIQIDKVGNQLGKWVGGRGIEDVIERLK